MEVKPPRRFKTIMYKYIYFFKTLERGKGKDEDMFPPRNNNFKYCRRED